MGIIRLNELPEGSGSLSNDDIFLFMDDPSGSGVTKKISLSDIGSVIGSVTSVAGKQGVVTLDHRDVGNLPTTLSQFTSNQNNLNLGTGGIIRISSDAARNITGFAATSSGDARLLVNTGSFTITLVHESSSSTVGNRIICVGSANLEVQPQGSVVVYYDGIDSRWRAG